MTFKRHSIYKEKRDQRQTLLMVTMNVGLTYVDIVYQCTKNTLLILYYLLIYPPSEIWNNHMGLTLQIKSYKGCSVCKKSY